MTTSPTCPELRMRLGSLYEEARYAHMKRQMKERGGAVHNMNDQYSQVSTDPERSRPLLQNGFRRSLDGPGTNPSESELGVGAPGVAAIPTQCGRISAF